MSRNFLDQETSPYLLQHKDNPVHWRGWNSRSLAEAEASGRPILLSIGYAACHWCHVMAHESFEDPETAELINRLYIPIKVDREERPDLDLIYQTALSSLGQHGGWPLTMFLSPKGEPFWGGTYFPPTSRFGRPGFRDVLLAVSQTYLQQPDKISTNVAAIREALLPLGKPPSGGRPSLALLDEAAMGIGRAIDHQHGGLSGAPKFPQVPLLTLLWRAARRTGRAEFEEAVLLSLDRMSQGGIYDHLGGGFARYATDEYWLVPHFEKMLYDNAALLDLLVAAWRATGNPLYAARIEETIGWLQREMITPEGAFAASLDADSEGHEGRYYVWQEAELETLLTADEAALFRNVYDVSAAGNWEGKNILHRNHPAGAFSPELEARLHPLRQRLLDARQRRVAPGRDGKMLADWNGMAIAALANAGFAMARPDWIALAERAFAAFLDDTDRLPHSMGWGKRQQEAILDDYAQMARAALLLHQVTGQSCYLVRAERWVALLDGHYWDDEGGGYFLTADDADDLLLRVKSANDMSVPSGNGVMVEVLARLAYLTGKELYRDRAEQLVIALSGELERNFAGLATLLNGWEMLETGIQAVLIGRPEDANHDALLRTLAGLAEPNLILSRFVPGEALPPGHPAEGKTADLMGQSAVYICRGPVCSLPVTRPEALLEQFSR